jgi:hypothetical protein
MNGEKRGEVVFFLELECYIRQGGVLLTVRKLKPEELEKKNPKNQ